MGGKAPVKLIVSLGCQAIPLSTRARTCLLPSHSTRTGVRARPKNQTQAAVWVGAVADFVWNICPRRCVGDPSDCSYRVSLRTAELARQLASALFSRGTWEMENLMERASLRQIKLRE